MPSWLSLLVLQPSPFCNINCDYCYLPDRAAKHRMEMATLERVIDEVFASDLVRDSLTIIWHAGEPLALPPDWYRGAFERIARRTPPGIRVEHSFQSNGTLLTQAWCDLIREFDLRIGLSIDGPARIHDAHRRTRAGRGTHATAMRGAQLLQANGIPFHVIAVVTADSLDAPDEIFDFFVGRGIRQIGFNIEELEGRHETSSLQERGVESRVAGFFRRIHERERGCRGAVCVRELAFARERVLRGGDASGEAYPLFNEQVRPFGILSVDWRGRFSTFSPELLGIPNAAYGDFTLGNIHDGRLLDAVRSDPFRRIVADVQRGVEACRAACPYFGLCGGGAPANKLFENGSFDSTETMYCRYSIQLPIDLVLEDLESSLAPASGPRA